jgi:hypothetical protein
MLPQDGPGWASTVSMRHSRSNKKLSVRQDFDFVIHRRDSGVQDAGLYAKYTTINIFTIYELSLGGHCRFAKDTDTLLSLCVLSSSWGFTDRNLLFYALLKHIFHPTKSHVV